MYKLIPLVVIAIALTNTGYADDSATQVTTVKIYRVGDLVSADAINTRSSFGKTSNKEWESEYPATLNALAELQTVVETMCSPKPIAVKAYSPSLSLIVRHTPDGHDEVKQLLQTLREDDQVSVHLECRAVFSDPAELKAKELTEAEQKRLESLLSNTRFTKDETGELLAFIPKPIHKHTVVLRSGRRTPWGDAERPCTATGRVDSANNIAQIRIDFISDDYSDATPFGSQVLSLADGESAFFTHYCDGGTVVWLVTSTISAQEKGRKPVSKASP